MGLRSALPPSRFLEGFDGRRYEASRGTNGTHATEYAAVDGGHGNHRLDEQPAIIPSASSTPG